MDINNYDTIADLYDTYVPATFDIDFFLRETQNTTGDVLELMSGTGRVSIPLLEAGVKLTCVDLSAELNQIFKQKLYQRGLTADIYQMDVCELELPRKFEKIIIPFHSFAHIVSPEDQRKALKRICEHLNPGGTFICTLSNPRMRQQTVNGQLRLFRKYPLVDKPGTLLLWIMENQDPEDSHVVDAMQFYEEYDTRGVLTSKRLMELHFRLTSRNVFEKLAQEAGFSIKAVYGNYDYAEFNEDCSPFMIWMLEKVTE